MNGYVSSQLQRHQSSAASLGKHTQSGDEAPGVSRMPPSARPAGNTPSSVTVINIISGEIGTNILKRDQGRELPDDSFYRPLKEEFANHVNRKPRQFPGTPSIDHRVDP